MNIIIWNFIDQLTFIIALCLKFCGFDKT